MDTTDIDLDIVGVCVWEEIEEINEIEGEVEQVTSVGLESEEMDSKTKSWNTFTIGSL